MSRAVNNGQLTGRMPKRVLGNTGQELSIIGLGGLSIADAELGHAKKVIVEAVEKGINYFDVSPTYGDAEVKFGQGLEPFRKSCFLACKTIRRDRAGAKEELDNSLKNLKTDYLDLYQLHAINDIEKDVQAALSKDGAIQIFIEAKKAGVIRYLGFSAHSEEAAIAAMEEFDFDTILYPINFCTYYKGKLGQEVLAQAKRRNMGILAIKSMALQKRHGQDKREQYPKCGYEPITEEELGRKALAWTLGQGVTAMLPPCEEALFRMAMNLGPELVKISEGQNAELEDMSAKLDPIYTA